MEQNKVSEEMVASSLCILMAFTFLITLLGMPGKVAAHERTYVYNQQYRTLPQGMFEIEQSVTSEVPSFHQTNENNFEYQTELEYGVTDKLTVAHYEKWETENKAGLDDSGVPNKDVTKYSGFKFETKYRIGEQGKYFIDPLLYFEIAHDPREEDIPLELEGKIVLSKDIDKFNITYNQIMESETGHRGRTTHEFTFGMNYELAPGFRAGVESEGQYWKPGTHRNEIALGPTIAWAGKYFWAAAGVLFGVNRAADDMETRIIIGVPFG